MLMRDDLAEDAKKRRAHLFSLAGPDVDCAVVTTPENIFYLTGYWSMALDTDRVHPMAAVTTRDSMHLVCPASDFGPAMEIIGNPTMFSLYGGFHFDVGPGIEDKELPQDRHPDFLAALCSVVKKIIGNVTSVVLEANEATYLPGQLSTAFPNINMSDGEALLRRSRAIKLPLEVSRLRTAAQVAEAGIEAGFTSAVAGMTEWEMAAVITGEIVRRGGVPGFIVVTSGSRAALADAYPSGRRIEPGDLIRVDIGCRVDGYWADTARTASMGEPGIRDRALYSMIASGEAHQLEHIRAGMTAAQAYHIAVETVRKAGLLHFQRHHCGHGLGLCCFESPALAPKDGTVLKQGMVLCVETPLYQLGSGGMMVEDTIVVETNGVSCLTNLDRGIWVVG